MAEAAYDILVEAHYNHRDKAATTFVNDLRDYITQNLKEIKVKIVVNNVVESAENFTLDSKFYITVNVCMY